MEERKNHKKLKSFGKNRREIQNKTTYTEDGHWISGQKEQDLRQKENPLFNRYYGELQRLGDVARATPQAGSVAPREMLSGEKAWEAEMRLFRTALPTTLWINDTDPLSGEVRAYFESLDASLVEPIPWYPVAGMGWRIKADKTEFRKREDMKALRQFLIQQTALGTISRQEEVSMIPPFLLDIQPTDVCLDMCGSPGSKTAQMLVALARHKVNHSAAVAGETNNSHSSSHSSGGRLSCHGFPFDYLTEGLVVANELDTKRANMLVHQVKRLRLLFPFALFTNHDARYFPELTLNPAEEGAEERTLRFDKILCDVVCSGDGTLRKAPHVFKIWTPREAMTLQKIQIQIALRAAHLLKIGGRLVYSTCSLNPIENEAVVAQIVHRTKGAMRLVDGRSLLPGLRCAPGMQTWTVTDAKGEIVKQPEGNMHEALFPPKTPGGYSSPAVDDLDFSLCMRLFPTHCSGGGFFVAVFDKVEEFQFQRREREEEGEESEGREAEAGRAGVEEEKQEEVKASETTSTTAAAAAPQTKKKRQSGERDGGAVVIVDGEPPQKKPRLAPPQFLPVPEEVQKEITDFFGMEKFPMQNVMIRAATGERVLRITQGSICNFVSTTAARILQHKKDSLLIVSGGLRLFAHESLTKQWRIACEAATLFPHYLESSPRTLHVPLKFIEAMMNREGNQKKMHFEDMKAQGYTALLEKVEALSLGPVFFVVHDVMRTTDGVFYTVGLRARSCLQLLVDHEDIEGVRLRMGIPPAVTTAPSVKETEEDGSAEGA